ncbi:oxidoreductase,Oxoglutarate/iron-dependent oxygenase family [Pseudohyphozyma bogoriensis]|nr:oxidoreductase,Oxoglutarate/iron-dependent oxygenase family [Pseudohyphozyma bogoriensis]
MSTSGVVPIIDFQPFLTGSQAEREATAQELLTAFKDVGFVMLKGFYQDGVVTEALVEEAFAQARTFFELSMVEKEKLAWTCPESNRGYVCQGRERVAPLSADKDAILALRAKAPDMKESIEIGKDYRDSEDDSPFPNLWPESMPEFRPFMVRLF